MIIVENLTVNIYTKECEEDSCYFTLNTEEERAKDALETLKNIYTEAITNPNGESFSVDSLLNVILKLQKYFYD